MKNQLDILVNAKGTEKAGSKLGGVARKIAGIGTAYFGATGLLNGAKASLEAFGRQELAEKKLETALGRTNQKLLDQASALQKVTTFGDEDIIMMQAMFASFGQNEQQIMKLSDGTLIMVPHLVHDTHDCVIVNSNLVFTHVVTRPFH